MNLDRWLPLIAVSSSLIPGLIIFFLPQAKVRTRNILSLTSAAMSFMVVLIMVWGVYNEHTYKMGLPLLPELDLVLQADALAVFFMLLSTGLWLVTTVYSIGYMEDSPHCSRFFGFLSLCVSSTVGIALAGNLITFLLFYELLTLCTYPLVAHRGTEAAKGAARVYLTYTFGGGILLFFGIVWLYTIAGTLEFVPHGFLSGLTDEHSMALIVIFVLLIAGLGVKAALVPLHGWLPRVMVAPAPVSALLHAVAVVKAGAFGIVRVVYDVYGVESARSLGVTGPLAMLAAATIVYGSVRALYQDDLKRRLAYSTVSQVSYITLGVAIAGPLATIGGIVHLVHQGLMKITLFFCAGNIKKTVGVHNVSEMAGMGRRMPWTMAAFTLAALGMIGVPPLAGFISKWYLGVGALQVGQGWVIPVIVGSSLLNAAYFLPIVYTAWFKSPPSTEHYEGSFGRKEASWFLLLPPLVTVFLALIAGLLASAPFSPLAWVHLIADLEYAP